MKTLKKILMLFAIPLPFYFLWVFSYLWYKFDICNNWYAFPYLATALFLTIIAFLCIFFLIEGLIKSRHDRTKEV